MKLYLSERCCCIDYLLKREHILVRWWGISTIGLAFSAMKTRTRQLLFHTHGQCLGKGTVWMQQQYNIKN